MVTVVESPGSIGPATVREAVPSPLSVQSLSASVVPAGSVSVRTTSVAVTSPWLNTVIV